VQVPILKQGAYLIATVQSALTDEDLKQLRDTLVLQVSKVRARGVIVDVTALDVIDSFATRTLLTCSTRVSRSCFKSSSVSADCTVAIR